MLAKLLEQTTEEKILFVRKELGYPDIPEPLTIREVMFTDAIMTNGKLVEMNRRFVQIRREGDAAIAKGRNEETIAIVSKLKDEAIVLKESVEQHLYLLSLYKEFTK